MNPKTGPIQFPGEAPGVYISNTDARILLHGRIGELKRIVRQCFNPHNPSAPVQRARVAPAECYRASLPGAALCHHCEEE